jgi:hypothetical protein
MSIQSSNFPTYFKPFFFSVHLFESASKYCSYIVIGYISYISLSLSAIYVLKKLSFVL